MCNIDHNEGMTEVEHSAHHASQPTTKPAKKKNRVSFIKLIVLVLLFALGVLGYMYYNANQKIQKLSTTQGQEEVAKKEVQELTDRLGKLTLLPEEDPVVATILDSQFLSTQSAFYKQAENGDKLVVYPKAQKAYIFSPTKNIIVNAGPLIVNQDQSTRPVKFEVRNGSGVGGAAAKMKEDLEKQNQLVSAMTDASRKDYQKTVIVAINPALKNGQLQEFAKNFNAELANEVPQGEAQSEADVLIIIGSEQQTASPKPSTSPTTTP
jgi:hypothetical protein